MSYQHFRLELLPAKFFVFGSSVAGLKGAGIREVRVRPPQFSKSRAQLFSRITTSSLFNIIT